MVLSELDRILLSDTDDEVELNLYHTILKRYEYLNRAIRFISEKADTSRKEHYIVLTPYVDSYDLPSDYIRIERMYDVRNQDVLKTTSLGMEKLKTEAHPRKYEILENPRRRKILFDNVPDDAYGTSYSVSVSLASSEFEITADDNWWDAPIVKVTDGSGNIEYIRISKVDAGTADGDKKLYISERDLTGNGQATIDTNASIQLVDIVMDYVYIPSDYVYLGPGTISSNGTDITGTNTEFSSENIGDYLWVYGEYRKIATVTDATTATIESAFDNAVSGAQYYLLRASAEPEMPREMHDLIARMGKVYALENESRLNEALQQEARVIGLLNDYGWRQFKERVGEYNKRRTLEQDKFKGLI